MTTSPQRNVRLGLKENWPQFTLLVLVNAFVGGMVGLDLTAAITAASPYVGRYAWVQEAEALLPAGQVIRGKADALIVHNDSSGELETPLSQHRLTPKNLITSATTRFVSPKGAATRACL